MRPISCLILVASLASNGSSNVGREPNPGADAGGPMGGAGDGGLGAGDAGSGATDAGPGAGDGELGMVGPMEVSPRTPVVAVRPTPA